MHTLEVIYKLVIAVPIAAGFVIAFILIVIGELFGLFS